MWVNLHVWFAAMQPHGRVIIIIVVFITIFLFRITVLGLVLICCQWMFCASSFCDISRKLWLDAASLNDHIGRLFHIPVQSPLYWIDAGVQSLYRSETLFLRDHVCVCLEVLLFYYSCVTYWCVVKNRLTASLHRRPVNSSVDWASVKLTD